jgi:Zn-dependent M28 family amino/carboxypeptidase
MSRRLYSRAVALFVAGLAALATPNASVVVSAKGPPPDPCDTQVNDTASKLVACIKTKDLWTHMQNFEAIAQKNPGPDGHPSRNSGEPGYKASADYVAGLMSAAGYNVTIQKYEIEYYAYKSIPTFSEASPVSNNYVLGTDWGPGRSTGIATASLQPAGGIIIPPTTTPSSTSGCTAADFGASTAGRIALIQRGGCNFGVKVLNAKNAGATGVIIFNEGNTEPNRTGLLVGSLVDANGTPFIPDIPVAFTTFAAGASLYNQYQQAIQNNTPLPSMNITIDAIVDPARDDYNVIAESKGGDPNHVVVVDAHLDAIYGEGMLDNASGSTTILDIALKMKNVTPTNKLRFIWFGGEEIGILGSKAYVDSLSSSDLSHIGYDLDADVTATPNYTIGVLDPAAPNLFGGATPTFPNRVYKASTVAESEAIGYFDSIGLNHELFSPQGTDAISFNNVGIPASGLLTGQDCCKTQQEVDLFGGTLGNFEGNLGSFDGGCVDNPFLWCDNLSNNDPTVLTFMSKAFAVMVVDMAFDTKVMSSSNSAVYSPKQPIAGETSRHFVAS